MGHLNKSVEFWTVALMLHDIYSSVNGAKKRLELVQGLQAAKDKLTEEEEDKQKE